MPKKKTIKKKTVKNTTKAKPKESSSAVLKKYFEDQVTGLFCRDKHFTFMGWFKRFSPMLISLLIGFSTYLYIVVYLFYPGFLNNNQYIQFIVLLIFVFFITGLFIYLGLRVELLFVRILSFSFVFILFTFLLLFILIAHSFPKVLG